MILYKPERERRGGGKQRIEEEEEEEKKEEGKRKGLDFACQMYVWSKCLKPK